MALTHSNPIELGSDITHFSLKGIDGKTHEPNHYDDKEVLVLIFMCNHCPYVKAITERLAELHQTHSPKGVQLIGINSNDTEMYPEDSFENMIEFAKDHGLEFPYLVDDTQETAKVYDAVCTPDIYVYDNERKLRYRGRLDDSWKDASAVTSHDLQNAIELLLDGKEIDFKQIPSMGCSIKWKN